MINLSPIACRFVQTERLGNLHSRRNERRAQLAEARAATTHPDLKDWKDEARAAVDEIESQLATDDERIAAAQKAADELDLVAAAELEAVARVTAAKTADEQGSIDTAEALANRDTFDAARSALRVRVRERERAARSLAGLLPQHGNLPELPGRDLVTAVANNVQAQAWGDPNMGPITPMQQKPLWAVWRKASDAEFAGLPLWMARTIKAAEAEIAATKIKSPNGESTDYRREYNVLPIDEFLWVMRQLKSTRVRAA